MIKHDEMKYDDGGGLLREKLVNSIAIDSMTSIH